MSSKLLNSSFLVHYSLLKKHSISVDFSQPGKTIPHISPASVIFHKYPISPIKIFLKATAKSLFLRVYTIRKAIKIENKLRFPISVYILEKVSVVKKILFK